jgi:hypothetical protein
VLLDLMGTWQATTDHLQGFLTLWADRGACR